jgi:hypothetical protein
VAQRRLFLTAPMVERIALRSRPMVPLPIVLKGCSVAKRVMLPRNSCNLNRVR